MMLAMTAVLKDQGNISIVEYSAACPDLIGDARTLPSDSTAQRAIPQFCTFNFAFCISADHLYSVAAEINTSSAVTECYEYYAYGNQNGYETRNF